MAPPLPYTVFALGDAQLHQIHTSIGKLFVMGEVAVELFQETPTAFLAIIRSGKFYRELSTERELLTTVLDLGLPVESAAGGGITLLPASTVEELLESKRRNDLVQPFRLGMLKLTSQETARLLASGQYDLALPLAMDGVKKGEALFRPPPALQMFPLYLLAAQAALGLRHAKQCEDFLSVACWLTTQRPEQTTNVMHSQLNRLYGQLYALQARHAHALEAFAKDVYCCSQEYGALDVRTSLGFYNLAKVFEAMGEGGKARANCAVVARIWLNAMMQVVLEVEPLEAGAQLERDEMDRPRLPLGTLQLVEVIEMLTDVTRTCKDESADIVAQAALAASLTWAYIGEHERAVAACSETAALGHKDSVFDELLQATQVLLGCS